MNQPSETSRTMFRIPVEVRWGDMDAFNHVNNARYLTYLEQARLAWMNTLDKGWMGPHCMPILASAHVDYRKPIVWPAQVEAILDCQRIGNSSLTMGHRIVDADQPDILYCDGHTVLVWIDTTTGKPVPLPESIRQAAQASSTGTPD